MRRIDIPMYDDTEDMEFWLSDDLDEFVWMERKLRKERMVKDDK